MILNDLFHFEHTCTSTSVDIQRCVYFLSGILNVFFVKDSLMFTDYLVSDN